MRQIKYLIPVLIALLITPLGCPKDDPVPPPPSQEEEPTSSDPGYYAGLANLQQHYGMVDRAMVNYKKAFELAQATGDKAMILADMAATCIKYSRIQEAQQYLGEAFGLETNVATKTSLHRLSYEIGMKSGDVVEAAKSLKYIELHGRHPKVREFIEGEKKKIFSDKKVVLTIVAGLESQLREGSGDDLALEALIEIYESVLDEPARAAGCLEKLAALNPKDPARLGRLADAYTALGEKKKAAEVNEKLLAFDRPGKINLVAKLVDNHLESGDIEAARKCIADVFGEIPQDAVIAERLAGLYTKTGMKDKAIECLKTTIKLKNDRTEKTRLSLVLTEWLADNKGVAEAKEILLTVLRDPADEMYHYNAARRFFKIVRQHEDVTETVKQMEKKHSGGEEDAAVPYLLLTAYALETHDADKAAALAAALAEGSDDNNAVLFKIESLCKSTSADVATVIYKKLAKVLPERRKKYFQWIARLCKARGDMNGCIGFLEQCVDEDSLPHELGELGVAYIEAEKYDKAVNVLKTATSRESEGSSPSLRERLAEAYEKSGEKEKAAKTLADLLQTTGGKSNRVRIVKKLAEAMNKLGRIDLLQKEAEEKLEESPDDITSLVTLARIFQIYKKDSEKTIQVLEKLRALEPGRPSHIAALCVAYERAGRTADCGELIKDFKPFPGLSANYLNVLIFEAYLEASEVDAAEAWIKKYIQAESSSSGSYILAGNLFEKYHQVDKAVEYFRLGVDNAREGMERDICELRLAGCLILSSKFEEAEKIISDVRKRAEPHSVVSVQIERLLAEMKRTVADAVAPE